jgi:hypothetical protein
MCAARGFAALSSCGASFISAPLRRTVTPAGLAARSFAPGGIGDLNSPAGASGT